MGSYFLPFPPYYHYQTKRSYRGKAVERVQTFSIGPRIYFGGDALAALEALAGRRVLVVTDSFLASSGLLDRVLSRLTGPVEVFSQVEPDPSLELVARGVAALRAFRPDAVVAFGGGSPMDCAKGMVWAAGAAPAERPPLWCIPTTAGTGSEVTAFAVLTDRQRGVKIPLIEEGLIPQAAILDPGPLEGVPPRVTADTGMDVLTHAAEAYVARGASPFSDALAEKAFALAWRSLPRAYGGDLEAKGEMLLCSCMAGMAFQAAGLGLCHAAAHALGGRFHVPHGRLNGVLLPHVIAFNAAGGEQTAARYGRLARACGLAGSPRALAAALVRLRAGLGIEGGLPIPAEELRAALPQVAADALADPCAAGDPRTPSAQDVERLIEEAAGG